MVEVLSEVDHCDSMPLVDTAMVEPIVYQTTSVVEAFSSVPPLTTIENRYQQQTATL